MPSLFPDSIRRALDRCSIPGLIRFVVLFNALVFILHLLAPGFIGMLTLDPNLVLQGQVWRLFTWIFIPETLSPFWIFFALLFLLYVGDGLEHAVGASKFTLFYLSGVIACTLVSFAFGLAGSGVPMARANTFLNLSLLLAYATVYPDFKVLVFFIIPMRIAWLAILSALLMIFSSLGQPLVVASTLAAAFLNYFLFFHRDLMAHFPLLNRGSARITASLLPLRPCIETVEYLHQCETCGRTEVSHPDLDFRVATSGAEYCREHLPNSRSLS